MTVFMELFQITELSLSNHKIRVHEQCELASVGASNVSFKYQETDCIFDFRPAFCWTLRTARPGEHKWAQVNLLFTQRGRWA